MRKFAVYIHRCNNTNAIIYAGIASEQPGKAYTDKQRFPRAFDWSHPAGGKGGRKPDHAAWLSCNDYSVEIAYEYDCRSEAKNKETELIKLIRPRFNRSENPDRM